MVTLELSTEPTAIDLARECLYRFLASAFMDPRSKGWGVLFDGESQKLARESAEFLREEAQAKQITLGLGEIPPTHLTLEPLLEELRKSPEEVRRQFDRIFGLVVCRECPPYETGYHPSSETFFRSQQLADINGFYRAFGIDPSLSMPERPDHIALELEFMAFLLMKKRLAIASACANPEAEDKIATCENALRNFFCDHLSWWISAFATGLRKKAETGFYAALSQMLAAFLPLERYLFEVPPPRLPIQAVLIERPEEQSGCTSCTVS